MKKRNTDKQRQYVRNHYNKNKQYYKDKAAAYKKLQKEKFFKFLKTLSCGTCGESDWRCLEFDHIDPSLKSNNVSTLVMGGASSKRLEDELAKCRVLCANCHRKHTATQQNWYKHLNSSLHPTE